MGGIISGAGKTMPTGDAQVPLFGGANKPTGITPVGPSAGQKAGRGAIGGALSGLGQQLQPQQQGGGQQFQPGPSAMSVDPGYFSGGQQQWPPQQRPSLY